MSKTDDIVWTAPPIAFGATRIAGGMTSHRVRGGFTLHPSRSRWIQGDYVAFGRCVQAEYLGGLEALNAGFAVFGIGVAHAFDIIVRFVRKGDVSVRVSLFFEGVRP